VCDVGLGKGLGIDGEVIDQTVHLIPAGGVCPDVQATDVRLQYGRVIPFQEQLPINPDLLDIGLLREDEEVPVVRPPTDVGGIACKIRERADVSADALRTSAAATRRVEVDNIIAPRSV